MSIGHAFMYKCFPLSKVDFLNNYFRVLYTIQLIQTVSSLPNIGIRI